MKPGRLVVLVATAVIAAAGIAACSSHQTSPAASSSATPTAPKPPVPQGVWQTQDLTALTGSPKGALLRISGYVVPTDGTQHALYGDESNHHLHELWWDKNGWHYDDLSEGTKALPGGDARAYASADGTQHAVWMGGFHIDQLSWNSSGKHAEDLSKAANAPETIDIFYPFDSQGGQHVIFVGRGNSHINELLSDNSGWHTRDLTTESGAPPSDLSSISGYEFKGAHHVVYTGTNGRHVNDLWLDQSGWHHDDLTAATGAPNSIGGTLTGYASDALGTEHVVYKSYVRAEKGGPIPDSLQELWSDGKTWQSNNLTKLVGAPADPWSLSGYVFEAQGTQHVFADGDRILELWSDATGWHTDDLSAMTSAPKAGGSGPASYVFEAQGTQHVVYIGLDDRHVHEIWWGPKA